MQQIDYSRCGNATTNVATKFLVKLQQQLMANNIIKGDVQQIPIYHHYVMRMSPWYCGLSCLLCSELGHSPLAPRPQMSLMYQSLMTDCYGALVKW